MKLKTLENVTKLYGNIEKYLTNYSAKREIMELLIITTSFLYVYAFCNLGYKLVDNNPEIKSALSLVLEEK